MKVVIVSPVFPHPKKGIYVGIERYVYEYSQALVKKGVEVHVITTFWNGGGKKEKHRGVYIHRVSDSSIKFGKIGRLFDFHYITFSRNILEYEDLLKSSDAVHAAFSLYSADFFRKNNILLVMHFHHKNEIRSAIDYLHLPFNFRNAKKAYQKADAVITTSEVNKEILVNEYSINEKLIKVIPHGVDISHFNKTRQKADSKIILYVGILSKRKGVKYLIKAMDIVRKRTIDIKLIIVGDGAERKYLKSLVKRLNLQKFVEFTGFVNEEKLIDYYRDADIFVFPSLKEGFGQVLVEAMACGIPVISTNTSAIPEVVGNAGILVKPRNSKALAEAIIKLIEDKDLRDELCRIGRKRVEENFTWDKIAEKMLKIYEEVIGGK